MTVVTGRQLVAVLGTALLATGCQAGGTTGPTEVTGIVHPTGAAELVLRIETGGGFVAPTFVLGQLPGLSVYGDGRVVTPGPQIEIYPGPALPSIVTFRLSEEGLQKLLENARAAGLLGPNAHYDFPGIADAPTTTFTVVAGGRRHVVSAYALSEGGTNDVPLDPEVKRARSALFAFESRALDPHSWLAAAIVEPDLAYRFDSLRVFATEAQPDQRGGIAPNLAEWPLASPLAAFGAPLANLPETRCGVVAGSDLATLLPAVQASNQLTFWRSAGKTFQLTLRPLLPDESGCPAGP